MRKAIFSVKNEFVINLRAKIRINELGMDINWNDRTVKLYIYKYICIYIQVYISYKLNFTLCTLWTMYRPGTMLPKSSQIWYFLLVISSIEMLFFN